MISRSSSLSKRLIPALLTLAVGGAGIGCIAAWRTDLPDPVATHWSGRTADGFTSVAGTLWMLGVGVAIGAVLCLIVLIPQVGSIAQRLTAGMACGTATFIVVLMTITIATQRGTADVAEAPLALWAIVPALVAGLLVGAVSAWTVPDRPSGRSFDPVGEVPCDAAPPVLPTEWAGPGVVVRLDPPRLTYRGMRGLVRIVVPVDRIVRAEVIAVDPFRDFGGWGYRISARARLKGAKGFVWRKGDALLVVYTDGGGPGSQRREIAVLDDARSAAGQINAIVVEP